MTRVGLGPDRITIGKVWVYMSIVQTFKNFNWGKVFYFEK